MLPSADAWNPFEAQRLQDALPDARVLLAGGIEYPALEELELDREPLARPGGRLSSRPLADEVSLHVAGMFVSILSRGRHGIRPKAYQSSYVLIGHGSFESNDVLV